MYKKPFDGTPKGVANDTIEKQSEQRLAFRTRMPARPRPALVVEEDTFEEESAVTIAPVSTAARMPVAAEDASLAKLQPAATARSASAVRDGERKSNPRDSVSVVDEWLTMRGDLETLGNLHVKGHVIGNIRCVSLLCEAGATIEGEIDAQSVTVRGHTKGVIRAKMVRLESTAVAESDIHHDSFSCEEGARIEGRLTFKKSQIEPTAIDASADDLAGL